MGEGAGRAPGLAFIPLRPTPPCRVAPLLSTAEDHDLYRRATLILPAPAAGWPVGHVEHPLRAGRRARVHPPAAGAAVPADAARLADAQRLARRPASRPGLGRRRRLRPCRDRPHGGGRRVVPAAGRGARTGGGRLPAGDGAGHAVHAARRDARPAPFRPGWRCRVRPPGPGHHYTVGEVLDRPPGPLGRAGSVRVSAHRASPGSARPGP